MNHYLFTVGIGVDDRPNRWLEICKIYATIAKGLISLGHSVEFAVNPLSLDRDALSHFRTSIGDHKDLEDIVSRKKVDFAFIWGGRIEADKKTCTILGDYGVTPVFSELGWFPQRGTIYFDLNGTNSRITPVTPKPLSNMQKTALRIRREWVSRKVYGCKLTSRTQTLGPSPLKIFVPLQDETDMNITEDSPFKKMNDFVEFLATLYPHDNFFVRTHPRAPSPFINSHQNVYFQEQAINPLKNLREFDLVLGINSTLLSEAAFLGHRVGCFGNGIAKIFGLANILDPKNPPINLQKVAWTKSSYDALYYLTSTIQLHQAELSKPNYLMSSYLADLLKLR